MGSYWITFRLENDAGYGQRYKALIDRLNEVGSQFWQEPTSFLAFKSEYSIDQIAGHLKKAVNPVKDLLLIRTIGSADTRYVGTPKEPHLLAAHFPEAKKV